MPQHASELDIFDVQSYALLAKSRTAVNRAPSVSRRSV